MSIVVDSQCHKVSEVEETMWQESYLTRDIILDGHKKYQKLKIAVVMLQF